MDKNFDTYTYTINIGGELVDKKTQCGKTAIDYCKDDKMRNLLRKYSSDNTGLNHSTSSLKRTTTIESIQIPNKELYSSVHPPSREDLELYLLILLTLVASYKASAEEGVECNLDSLRISYEGLKRHIGLMSSSPSSKNKLSVRSKLCLKQIGKVLQVV